MKTFFLSALLTCFFPGIINAQIEQGTIFLGANAGLNYSSQDFDVIDDNLNVLEIDLNVGSFIADNFLLGVSFGYFASGFGELDGSSVTLGAFGRYYFNTPVFFGLGYESVNPDGGDALGRIPFRIGYAAFLTETVALEPSVVYAFGVGDNESNILEINIGFGIYFR